MLTAGCARNVVARQDGRVVEVVHKALRLQLLARLCGNAGQRVLFSHYIAINYQSPQPTINSQTQVYPSVTRITLPVEAAHSLQVRPPTTRHSQPRTRKASRYLCPRKG